LFAEPRQRPLRLYVSRAVLGRFVLLARALRVR
jgi:hypothetical protein